MKNVKIIGKVATLFGAVSIVFAVLGAIATYEQIAITAAASGQTIPADYMTFYILSTILPYLFVAALSLIVAVILRSSGKEIIEKETVPQTQPTE